MTAILQAEGLGKRYGRKSALTDCTLSIPPGRVVGLIGPNGAGKSTLLGLATGLIRPTTGSISVLGGRPAANVAQLAKVGFVAQDTPVYAGLSVADHLRLGARMNPAWDRQLAGRRIQEVGLDPAQKAGRLSGGQRAQLALTLAAAKRPELLLFDEPVASLDPLARRAFLRNLTEFVAELQISVVLSSHLLSDLEQVCDYLIVLVDSRIHLAGEVEDLLAVHHLLTGDRDNFDRLPATVEVISDEQSGRHRAAVVRCPVPLPESALQVAPVTLEQLALAYLTRAAEATGTGLPAMPVQVPR